MQREGNKIEHDKLQEIEQKFIPPPGNKSRQGKRT
jgi:hypothetical protein